MKYPDEHWQKVAGMVNSGKDAYAIQNHYPFSTVGTVRKWIKRCEKMGLIEVQK